MADAAGVAVSSFTWIGGYLVTPIARHFHYLTRFNENVEMLRKELQKLRDERDDMQQEVNEAERNGREIKKQVQIWLRDMDLFIKEVERLVNEIESNESRLHGWHADWRLRYKLGKQARRKLKSMLDRQGGGSMGNASVSLLAPPQSVDLIPVSFPAPPPRIEAMSTKDFVAFASTKSTMHLVIEALKDENCNIVGLYGMGGVGKTTLVKEVGKQVKESKLFDQVVMAVVSQNPDLWKIQGQIADILGLKFVEETESGRAARLKERIKKEKSILVILDDIWKRLDLNAVGIPRGHEHKGCKIILTSRLESICDGMGSQTKKIPVGVLTEQESWDLFKKIVGTDIDSSSLNGVAREIVGRCRGLPLALVLVGSALREKELDEWNAAARQLAKSKTPDIEGVDKDVYSCLQLSYDYLQGE